MLPKYSLLFISFCLLNLVSAFLVYLSETSGETAHFHEAKARP